LVIGEGIDLLVQIKGSQGQDECENAGPDEPPTNAPKGWGHGSLEGEVVMVESAPWWILVGGRRRLGRLAAESLAGGANLVLTSSRPWKDEQRWVEDLSRRCQIRTLQWDADDASLASTMMADLEALGSQGIQPFCAVILAGSFPEQPLGSWTPAELERTWLINLTFPLLAAQILGPRLREGGCLQILLDTSIHRPWLKRLPYSAAKAGLAAAVSGLAQLLAPKVRVVGHALGTVLPDESSDPECLAQRCLLKRNGEPEDLIRALRYAAESPYLTGEILTLDGGRRWV
jgi:NAD(P)-dependent dehydrogenase (short-subunit alcohol dehydrogenase family)